MQLTLHCGIAAMVRLEKMQSLMAVCKFGSAALHLHLLAKYLRQIVFIAQDQV
jgi:hypothetical protein